MRIIVRVKLNKKELKSFAAAQTRRLILTELLTKLVELQSDTPIDTGAARDGWTLVLNGTDTGLSRVDLHAIQILYSFVNAVTYVEFLNQGSSIQAPKFFIESDLLSLGKPYGKVVEKL